MTSQLSTGTTRRQSPAYCKKGRYNGILPMINGMPKVMNAYAAYRYLGTGIDVDANELIHLRRNATANGWDGHVTDGENVLTAEMLDPPTGYTFTMRIRLAVAGVPIHTFTWLHTQPDPAAHWETGTKTAVLIPLDHQAALRITG